MSRMVSARRAVVFVWAALAMGVGALAQDGSRFRTLERLASDPSPAVRAQALRGLATIGTAEAAAVALRAAEGELDANLEYALWLTINDLAEPWIAAVESGAWSPEGRERQLLYALKALPPEKTRRVLGGVFEGKPLPADGGAWIEILGAAGGPQMLAQMFRQAADGALNAGATTRVLAALSEAWRLRQAKPNGDLSRIADLLGHSNPETRVAAARLAGQWAGAGAADEKTTRALAEMAGNSGSSKAERTAALDALRQTGTPQAREALEALSRAPRPAELRRAAAIGLAALDLGSGIPAALEAAATAQDEAQALEFWRALLGVKGIAPALTEALEGRRLPAEVARAGVRVAREGGRDDVLLATAFATAGGIASSSEAFTRELIAELAREAEAKGNPERGEWVYRRAELACLTCHAIGGAGGLAGPDLTSIGASAPMDYLVEALLLPNEKIKEGYHSILVETADGEEVTGTLARETPQELFLRNAAGQEVAVAKTSIVRRETGRLSLMPSGLLDPLNEQERFDLFAFLGRLGKPGRFDASRGGVARKWWVANLVHTDLQNNQGDWFWERPWTDGRWTLVYSLVSGDAPGAAIEEAARAQAWTSKVAVVLATELESAQATRARLRLTPADAGELWVNRKRVEAGRDVEIGAGRSRVVVKVDPRRLPESVRLEVEGAAFVAQ